MATGEGASRAVDGDECRWRVSGGTVKVARMGDRGGQQKGDTPIVSLLEQGRDPPLLQTRDNGGRRQKLTQGEVGVWGGGESAAKKPHALAFGARRGLRSVSGSQGGRGRKKGKCVPRVGGSERESRCQTKMRETMKRQALGVFTPAFEAAFKLISMRKTTKRRFSRDKLSEK